MQWKTQGDSCHHVVTTLGLSVMTDMYPWQATVIPVPNLCMLGVYSALQEVRQQKRHGHGTILAIEMSQNKLGRSPTLCTSCNAPEDQTKPIQGLDAGMQAQAVCWRQGVRRAAPKRVGAALQGTNRASSTSLRRCIRHTYIQQLLYKYIIMHVCTYAYISREVEKAEHSHSPQLCWVLALSSPEQGIEARLPILRRLRAFNFFSF